MANIKSFPNNQDEYVGAEHVMRWLHGRTSGVFGADGNAAVAPVLDAMAVTVSDGNGWISNDNADGVVWWIDNEVATGGKLQLSVDMADAVLPRIDRVVVSWQTTNYVALPEVTILKGTAASTPAAPELTNNNTLRQISLASIHIPAGATAITSVMITDERLNPEVCGIVSECVKADTSMVNAQYLAAVEELRKAIQQAWNGEIPNGSITQEMLDPNIKLGSNDIYIGSDEPTGEDLPKLWIDPEGGILTPEQIGALAAVESTEYPGCYYRTVDGVVEWVNPPMNTGDVYRTPERVNGKAVYVALVNCGALTTGRKAVEVPSLGGCVPISVAGYVSQGNGNYTMIPSIYESTTETTSIVVLVNTTGSTGYIQLWAGSEFSGKTAYVQVKYFKP